VREAQLRPWLGTRPGQRVGASARLSRVGGCVHRPSRRSIGAMSGSNSVWLALGLALVGCGKSAVPIPGVVSTGMDDQGKPLAARVADPHYDLVKHPDDPRVGPVVFVIDDTRGPIATGSWTLNDMKSKWVGPTSDAGSSHPGGEYRYKLEFDLTGFDPATAEIRGRWSSDDRGVAIVLNDVATGISHEDGPRKISGEFEITKGFVAGKNVMVFIVTNAVETEANPSGLRVELSGKAKKK
jgi:hypothetical protein